MEFVFIFTAFWLGIAGAAEMTKPETDKQFMERIVQEDMIRNACQLRKLEKKIKECPDA